MDKQREQMLREVQLENCKSLKKLDEICKRHGLQYWMMYGSLIGVVRHKGFIPWDDDIDVGMMRDDFEKLRQIPASEWGDDFVFMDGECDDIVHDMMFGRVYQAKSRIQSHNDVNYWKDPTTHKSWYTKLICDIFIFDMVPDDHAEYLKLYKKICTYGKKKYKWTKLEFNAEGNGLAGFAKCAYGKMMRKIYKKPWLNLYHKYRQMIKNSQHGSRIGTYYTEDTDCYEYDEVFPLQEAPFEDMMVPIPKNYDQMLKNMYGNYMDFPPENERGHIDFTYVDLGDDRTYVIDPIPGALGCEEEKTTSNIINA